MGWDGVWVGLGGSATTMPPCSSQEQEQQEAARSSKKQYWQSTAMPKDGKGCHADWIIGAGREKAWRKLPVRAGHLG